MSARIEDGVLVYRREVQIPRGHVDVGARGGRAVQLKEGVGSLKTFLIE